MTTAGYYTVQVAANYGQETLSATTVIYVEPDLMEPDLASCNWPKWLFGDTQFTSGVIPSINSSGNTGFAVIEPSRLGAANTGIYKVFSVNGSSNTVTNQKAEVEEAANGVFDIPQDVALTRFSRRVGIALHSAGFLDFDVLNLEFLPADDLQWKAALHTDERILLQVVLLHHTQRNTGPLERSRSPVARAPPMYQVELLQTQTPAILERSR